ncbi:MAG: phospho-N-acetylmuramoyl-pentapeptide-transferase [Bacilli bacterium]|nr:phospho-N-acetylmuramoyl-pentapeptide-transferase [Bacilli bacterium]
MLILAKTVLGIMLGFILSIIVGLVLIPFLKKHNIGQFTTDTINERHVKKQGTPTIGGLIFIIPTIISVLVLFFKGSLELNHNLIITLIVFVAYGLIGFLDDYLKIRRKNNSGLSIKVKFILELIIAITFYVIYKYNGGLTDLTISLFGLKIQLGYLFGLFILFLLVGTTNAVNITDGLDGLCGGLSAVAFLAYGVISWGSYWITGYQEIAIFCFILTGAILGFLVFNTHPAKVFMGDTGSLALGGALATVAILTRHELSLAIIGGVFVIETLSSMIQIIAIKKFKKRVFLRAPLHHHFEQLGWSETDIVKMFWIIGFMLGMLGIIYGVWL